MSSFDIEKLLDAMPLNIYWKDKNGRYLKCNLAQAHFFGLKDSSEMIGKTDVQLSSNSESAKTWMQNDQKVMQEGTPFFAEEKATINGNTTSGISCKVPFKDDSGNVAGIMGISIDITAQKKIEATLLEEKKNTQIALDNIIARLPGHVYWMDKDNKFLGCNDLQAKSAGLSDRHDIVGKTNSEMPWFELADTLNDLNNRVMATGEEHTEEETAHLADGSVRTFVSRKAPLLDDNGKTVGILGISFDITDRKQMEEELVKAKEAAEAANRAKTEFLANMSHDVKTPMTGVVGVAELMMHNSDWRTPEKAEIIHSCGMQVLSFFNSCLELSKLEMAEWDAPKESFSLSSLLEEIYALFVPRAQSKGLEFKIDYEPNVPNTVNGYRGSVYRVVLNLVGNALKFTEKGSVTVRVFLVESVDQENIRVGIAVSDTGVGIPEDKHQVIFEKLRRLTPSYQGKIEGSGIGLYIVDQYVKHMGGEIQVKSKLGEGSTFTVILPVSITAGAVVSPTPTPHQASASVIQAPVNQQQTQSSIERAHAKTLAHILLVEDMPMVQMITKNLLSKAGFAVDIAGSGEEAVEKFSPGMYGLIYMDIGLPKMDGYETTRAIRAKEKTLHAEKSVPIVALTGHAALDVKEFCHQAGMQGVLSKPLSHEQAEKVWQRFGEHADVDVPGLTHLSPDNGG